MNRSSFVMDPPSIVLGMSLTDAAAAGSAAPLSGDRGVTFRSHCMVDALQRRVCWIDAVASSLAGGVSP
jgi:hypothetical protein